MAQTLNLSNFDSLNIIGQTQLTATAPVGSSSLAVVNTDDFTSGVYLLIGTKGADGSELLLSNATVSASSIPLLSPTGLPHNQFDPVYALFGSQIKVYRASDAGLGQQPADSAFAPIATINIDSASATTTYTDSSGGGNYWYKFTYFNPGTLDETGLDSSVAIRGSFRNNYCSIDAIRERAGFNHADFVTDTKIDSFRQASQEEIDGKLHEFYNIPFAQPIPDRIRDITERLSAGQLLIDEYSSTNSTKTKNGEAMRDQARVDIELLCMKQEVVHDKSGNSLALASSTGGVSAWPNSSTATADPSQGGSDRAFRMGMLSGYHSREI